MARMAYMLTHRRQYQSTQRGPHYVGHVTGECLPRGSVERPIERGGLD